MRRDIDVLVLCDAALEAGYATRRREIEVEKAFIDTKVELNFVLKAIVKAAGGQLRGHELCTQDVGYTKSRRIYIIPGKGAGPYIDGSSGEIGDCSEPQHLVQVWRALPGILSQHIAACADDAERIDQVVKQMATIWHGSQTLRALAQSAVPKDQKQAFMERVLGDEDLQDALKAAAATGEDNAPLKVIREQAEQEAGGR